MVSHAGVRNALGIPKWGWVAGYEWSVDSGHDDDGRCGVAKEKMGYLSSRESLVRTGAETAGI